MLWESNNSLAPIHVLPVFEAVQILEEGRHAFTHGAADYGDISSQKNKSEQEFKFPHFKWKSLVRNLFDWFESDAF